MKKLLSLILVMAFALCLLVSCGGDKGNDGQTPPAGDTNTPADKETDKNPPVEEPYVDPNAKSEGVMTYAEYLAADMDAEVIIEGFVQGKQSWWDNKATIYLQDGDGAYFAYEMTCSEEDYNKLYSGTKIRVTGYKTEYHGEIEIDSGCTFEFAGDDKWVADPTDVTSLLGKDELVEKQNMLVIFKGLTVEGIEFKGGAAGDDIYVSVSLDGNTYSFCVERYLTGPETEVYGLVSGLKAGDKGDITGFLYWYDGVNTHITGVEVK